MSSTISVGRDGWVDTARGGLGMKRRLEGKAIIVVGAGTKGEGLGNGKAAALQFAREGAKVLCVDQCESAAATTAKIIREEGGEAEVCVADIVNAKECERIVEACLKHFQKLDVLHNNVGIPSMREIVDTSEEAWVKTFDVNVKGMFLMCRQAIPLMKAGGGGSIINVSSVASIRAFPDAAYVSSKSAVNALTLYLAGRYARYNIRANVLLLGYIDTPLARPAWVNDKVREINLRQVPMRRFASPWEVATVAAFLASDEASYVTGAIIPVDGGLTVTL
jgi:NAD(P)-dependent dehydrogenase (short-subunit alcohol dehydrogenase family)